MITDKFENNVAGLIGGEIATIPSHIIFSTSVITPNATDTALPSELDRSVATKSRITKNITFTAIRSGSVASTGGDIINSLGLGTAPTGGDLLGEAVVSSLLHTTAFDLQVDWLISVQRK